MKKHKAPAFLITINPRPKRRSKRKQKTPFGFNDTTKTGTTPAGIEVVMNLTGRLMVQERVLYFSKKKKAW